MLVRIGIQASSFSGRPVHSRLIVQLRQVGVDLSLTHLRDELLQLRIVKGHALLALTDLGQACWRGGSGLSCLVEGPLAGHAAPAGRIPDAQGISRASTVTSPGLPRSRHHLRTASGICADFLHARVLDASHFSQPRR